MVADLEERSICSRRTPAPVCGDSVLQNAQFLARRDVDSPERSAGADGCARVRLRALIRLAVPKSSNSTRPTRPIRHPRIRISSPELFGYAPESRNPGGRCVWNVLDSGFRWNEGWGQQAANPDCGKAL